MVHIEAPELMDCQLCGGVAHLHGGSFEAYAYCATCSSHGPETEYNTFDPDQNDETIAGEQARAVELWNQMQGWIAKGRILEGMALPSGAKEKKKSL